MYEAMRVLIFAGSRGSDIVREDDESEGEKAVRDCGLEHIADTDLLQERQK